MIDKEKLARIRTELSDGPEDENQLAAFSEAELRRLRSEIDRTLPPDTLVALDLETELVSQYRKTKDLMDEVMNDKLCPTNQKAQVANSVVSTLAQLIKLQEDLRREETLKIMEECLTDALKALPDEVRQAFYAEYERLAAKAGLL